MRERRGDVSTIELIGHIFDCGLGITPDHCRRVLHYGHAGVDDEAVKF
jgi:hypothetical protein